MDAPLQPNEYRCAECRGVFEKGRSDEDAMAEKEVLFPDFPVTDCDLVCDDCFKKMGFI